VTSADGNEELLSYDKLVVGTGALPVRPPIGGLTGPDALGPGDGVHLLHSMGDTFALMRAGDCVVTWHRLLGETYLPLGTTAHKQGRVNGENALGGSREFAGSLGTQVVKIFDQAAARIGLRDHGPWEAVQMGAQSWLREASQH